MNIEIRMPAVSRADGWVWARSTAAILASRVDGRAVLDAIDYFEQLLGADWPGWAKGYPLANTFFTGVNSEEVTGVELHRLLASLHDEPDIGEVIGQLKSPAWEQFVAATMVLRLASGARRSAIKTQILRARGKHIADLRLDVAGRWLTLECLALHETAVMREAERVDVVLSRWLAESGIDRLGRTTVTILHEPSPSEVLERLPELKEAIHTIVREGRSEAEVETLAKVSFERGLSPLPVPLSGLGSEPLDSDIRRLRHRMREKSRQLVANGPSILVVRTRHLFAFDPHREEMLVLLLAMLHQELGGLPDISAVLVYETWLGSGPPARTRRAGRFAVVEGTDSRGRARVSAFVASGSAVHPLTRAEIDAFVGNESFW
ncbi:MAG: hypothetical protein KF894_23790, partial [Labilithrix sp.]|nr:hypothetical protein [Labilithrix sp.]